MRVSEFHAFPRETIHIRRRNFAVSIETFDVAISQIVAENVDDVGLLRRMKRSAHHRHDERRKQ